MTPTIGLVTIQNYDNVIDCISYAVHYIPVTYFISGSLYLLIPFTYFPCLPNHFPLRLKPNSLFPVFVNLFLFCFAF